MLKNCKIRPIDERIYEYAAGMGVGRSALNKLYPIPKNKITGVYVDMGVDFDLSILDLKTKISKNRDNTGQGFYQRGEYGLADSIEQTIIARYGIDGDYLSGMCFGKNAFDVGDFKHPLAYAYAMIKDRPEAQEQIAAVSRFK